MQIAVLLASPQTMTKQATSFRDNPVWKLFSSVRLAIVLLILLAITSIAGTVLPQGEPMQFYLENYPNLFKLIKAAKLYSMYDAWWFVAIMVLFAINLIVCTINRLPITMQLYSKDFLDISKERLLKAPSCTKIILSRPEEARQLTEAFHKAAGGGKTRSVAGAELILAEEGKWSCWGLYILHSSIIVIMVGALIGNFLGFKGNLMLFEGEASDQIVERGSDRNIPLGFTIKCEDFDVEFYDNGAPKEYLSELTIFENNKEVLKKTIRVNDPLRYKGITFYQSSFDSAPEVKFNITSASGASKALNIPAFDRIWWEEAGLHFGLMRFLPNVHGTVAANIWISDKKSEPQAIWFVQGREKEFNYGGNLYKATVKEVSQRFMTGLQVKKDPGVWVVWLGCVLLIAGFVVVFWVPHVRIWLWVGEEEGVKVAVLAGQSNKNQIAFKKDFEKIEQALRSSI